MSWKKLQFRDFVTLQRGFDLPKSQMKPGEVPVFGSQSVVGFHYEPKVEGPGVITGRSGTLGKVQFTEEPYWPHNTSLWVKDFKGNSPRFVFYKLQTLHLERFNGGVSVPTLNRNVLDTLPVDVPARPVQAAIADILSAYDDLIENNRRRMALLEESARLLYREWFVHLRFPGHEHVPITDGVPEGWERKPLEEIAEFRLGKMLDQNKNKGEMMPYLANVNVRWGGFDLIDLREMRFESDELETYGLKVGDIVMCEGGEPGRCAIWKGQVSGMMIQKALHRIRCRENMPSVFLYYSLRHLGEAGHLASLFTGATIKHLPRQQLAKVSVLVPPRPVLEAFSDFVDPVERQMGLLEASNRRAAEARDLLLPRLMNGEIDV